MNYKTLIPIALNDFLLVVIATCGQRKLCDGIPHFQAKKYLSNKLNY